MPPMGGVTGAMKGTGGSMGKKKERPKNTKNTIIRLFSYMKETKLQLAGALCSREYSQYACGIVYVKAGD